MNDRLNRRRNNIEHRPREGDEYVRTASNGVIRRRAALQDRDCHGQTISSQRQRTIDGMMELIPPRGTSCDWPVSVMMMNRMPWNRMKDVRILRQHATW